VNCSEVQSRLSAHHDGELPPTEVARVTAHVADCPSCAAELASFDRLSGLSRRLTDPPVPAHLWEELRSKLDASAEPRTILARPRKGVRHILLRRLRKMSQTPAILKPLLALAATVLVAVGIWGAYDNWFSPRGDDHLMMNFAHYLEEFSESPDNAQQILLAKYDGRPTTLAEATKILGYEPLAAKGLPPDCSLEKVYLLNMPCCMCAQIICRNQEGQSIAIFEHDMHQPVSYGDRPAVECLCDKIPTSVMQVGNKLAATWKEGKRHVSIVGAANLEEVTEFVAHFSGSNPDKG